MRKEGEIAAHGGIWPVRLASAKGQLKVIHLVDWAARRTVPGVGIHLVRNLADIADMLLTIGGSDYTRRILPKIGYRQFGEFRRYARVIRPLLQFRTTPYHNWKSPLRLFRNTKWAWPAILPPPAGWHAVNISTFQPSVYDLTQTTIAGFTSSLRTAAGLNHLLACPAAKFSAFLIHDSGQPSGYFILAQIGHQSRIVDVQIDRTGDEVWQAAYEVATRTAAEDNTICEIIAGSSVEPSNQALEHLGFRLRRVEPIYCYDPRASLSAAPPIRLTLADGDICFLSNPAFPYLT